MEEEKVSQYLPHEEEQRSFGVWGVVLLVLVIAAVVSLGFVVHEHGVAKQLSTQNSAMATTLDQTRAQLDQVTAKLNEFSAAQAAAEAQRVAAAERATKVQHTRVRRDDPRWKKVQDELAEHQKAIESTQTDLASARTELSGSIARTHEDLVALAKRGERTYFEFDLNRSKQFSKQGPVSVSLRKANPKHDYADLALLVGDAAITKKHVNLFEPVMVYAGENSQPVELVINQVSKDHIHGYVSSPKYKASELPQLSSLTDSSAQTTQSTPANGTPELQTRK